MSTPLPQEEQLTPGEMVSRMAEQVAMEQTETMISEALMTRCKRPFRGAHVRTTYDLASAWYVAKLNIAIQGKSYTHSVSLREEDIYEHTTSTADWNAYIDQMAELLMNGMRDKLIAAGVGSVPSDRLNQGSIQNSLTANLAGSAAQAAASMSKLGQAMNTFGGSVKGMHPQMSWVDEAAGDEIAELERKIDLAEEKQAIESIKRAAERQGE